MYNIIYTNVKYIPDSQIPCIWQNAPFDGHIFECHE